MLAKMDSRRYSRPLSPPPHQHGRSSLPMLGYSGYTDLHAVPARREVITDPRSSDERLTPQSPVAAAAYKINPESLVARSPSLLDKNRRTTLDSTSVSRPHVRNPQARRPAIHGGADRPSSPTSNPYRSSDETEEYVTIPASSGKYRGHARGAYSETIDNSDVKLGKEAGSGGLLRIGSGREGSIYPRTRPVYPMSAGRHHDAVIDGYGDDGYGYTTPGDLAQYDLDRAAKYPSRRRESFEGSRALRPLSISGYPDPIARSFDARERGPPPATRGFDRLAPRPALYDPAPFRMPVTPVEPVVFSPRGENFYETESMRKNSSRRPVSIYHESGLSRRYPDDYEVDDDTRDRRNTKYHAKHYDDGVEHRGFGVRTEHIDENGYDRRKEYERRHEYDKHHDYDYDDRLNHKAARDKAAVTKKDGEKGKDFEGYEDRPERKRDKTSGLSTAASALGAIAHDPRDHEREREGRESPRRRRDDEEPRKRDDAQDDRAHADPATKEAKERQSPEDNKGSAAGERDKKDSVQAKGEAPDVVGLGGRNPRERQPSRDHRGEPPETSGRSQKADRAEAREDSPVSDETKGQRARRDRGSRDGPTVPFNPKDTMDLRAVREALSKGETTKEPVRDPVREPVREPVRDHLREPLREPLRDESFDRRPLSDDRGRRDQADDEPRGPTPRLVSPPREEPKKAEEKPVKGILRQPRDKFPEDPMQVREGVAPLKDAKKDGIPPDARWTKISRRLVNPDALDLGKERYEARDDFVIVLRVLSKEEVQGYAEATAKLRAARDAMEAREDERRRHRRDRAQRYERDQPYRDAYDYGHDHRRHATERHPHSSEADAVADGEQPKVRRITYDESAMAALGSERERDRERDREPNREPNRESDQPVGLREDPDNPGTYLGYVRNPLPRRDR